MYLLKQYPNTHVNREKMISMFVMSALICVCKEYVFRKILENVKIEETENKQHKESSDLFINAINGEFCKTNQP